MSWQSYVDTNLVGSGHVSQGAIYGHNGGLWAASPGFQISTTEVQEIIKGFSNPDGIRGTGVHINGEKYFVLRADERSIYGKLLDNGCCIVKSNQAILLATYQKGIQPGQCTKVVEDLADYFISVGY